MSVDSFDEPESGNLTNQESITRSHGILGRHAVALNFSHHLMLGGGPVVVSLPWHPGTHMILSWEEQRCHKKKDAK